MSGIHRATQARVVAAALRIDNHIASNHESQPGCQATRAYWAINQARLPHDAPVATPQGQTFSQLQYIDEQQQSIESRLSTTESEFVTMRCRLNGSVIPMDLHLGDLRARLGLPAYPLVPPLRAPIISPPPVENMENTDCIDPCSQEDHI